MEIANQTIKTIAPKRVFTTFHGWSIITISGPQQEKFTKGLLSNKIVGIQPGEGRPTLILTPKGRMISELLVIKRHHELMFLVPPGCHQHAVQFFEHYHVIEEIEIVERNDLQTFFLAGSQLSPFLNDLQIASLPQEQGASLSKLYGFEQEAWLTRFSLMPPLQMLILHTSKENESFFQDLLKNAGFDSFNKKQWSTLQAQCNWLDSQSELHELLVHEAALEHSHVHFKKGCWVGQEVVARTHYRGQANKAYFLLTSSQSVQTDPPAPICNQDGKKIGFARSCWKHDAENFLIRALLNKKHGSEMEECFAIDTISNSSIQLLRTKIDFQN